VREFIEECRREWRRLRVPADVADEMAADLEADLAEAAAEGASPEAVLGAAAREPRSLAASWAQARGVARPLRLRRKLVAFSAILIVAVLASGAAILLFPGSRTEIGLPVPPAARPMPPSSTSASTPPPRVTIPDDSGRTLGLVLILVGLAGGAVVVVGRPWRASGAVLAP
jgi:hypothetical protein